MGQTGPIGCFHFPNPMSCSYRAADSGQSNMTWSCGALKKDRSSLSLICLGESQGSLGVRHCEHTEKEANPEEIRRIVSKREID